MVQARIAHGAKGIAKGISSRRHALCALNTNDIGNNRKNAIQNYYQYY
jgi:hypothetical protein